MLSRGWGLVKLSLVLSLRALASRCSNFLASTSKPKTSDPLPEALNRKPEKHCSKPVFQEAEYKGRRN